MFNSNSVAPRKFYYDPILHTNPIEQRHYSFNKSLQEFDSKELETRIVDFDYQCKRHGLVNSKDIRHIRNKSYVTIAEKLAVDILCYFNQQ